MSEVPEQRIEELTELHPADVADELQRIEEISDAVAVFRRIPIELAAEAFAELEPEVIQDFSLHLSERELAEILSQLPHNDSTDIVGELPEERQQGVLDQLPTDVASPLRELLQYPEDTAGGIMNDDYTRLDARGTVGDALARLRKAEQEEESVSYLYVTDTEQRLLGTVSFRDLVLSKPETPLRNVTNLEVMRLTVTDDQEEIARQFEHYHFLALPVVDAEDRLVGVVQANVALEIAKEEATEDMQLMVGLSGEEHALTPWSRAVARRLPWLYVNLMTAFAAAAVVAIYESTIAKWTALAVFLPIIAGQGGNAGMQTLTVIIRDMALGELSPGDGRRALSKELLVGTVNGIAVGLVVGIVGYLWQGSLLLGAIVTAAMVLNQMTAALAGVLIPFTLKAFRVDPALASSIFLTTVTDIGGFFFFLWLAAYFLERA